MEERVLNIIMPIRRSATYCPPPGSEVRDWILIERTAWTRIHLQQVIEREAGQVGRIERIDADAIPEIAPTAEGVEERPCRQDRVAGHHHVELCPLLDRCEHLLMQVIAEVVTRQRADIGSINKGKRYSKGC